MIVSDTEETNYGFPQTIRSVFPESQAQICVYTKSEMPANM